MQKTNRFAVITEWSNPYATLKDTCTIKRKIYSDGYQDFVRVNKHFVELDYYRLSKWHMVAEFKEKKWYD